MIAFLLCIALALAAALLGVAAGRRRHWCRMQVCGVACLLALFAVAAILTTREVTLQ